MKQHLPAGWTLSTIGEVTTAVQQCVPEPQKQFTYVDISSIDREAKRVTNPRQLSGREAPSRARQAIATGDVLVSLTRPNLNAVALVPKDLDGQIASTGFVVLRPIEIDNRWLFFFVRSQEFVSAMSDMVQGALYPAIKAKDVRGFRIPIAPLNEEKRIADKLEALLARIDSCRTHLGRVPEILGRFRRSVLGAAATGELIERSKAVGDTCIAQIELGQNGL